MTTRDHDPAALDTRYWHAISTILGGPTAARALIGIDDDADRPMERTPSPLTGSEGLAVPRGAPADIEAAIERARLAQPAWARLGSARRAALIRRLSDLVWQYQTELLDIIQWENGKARSHAFEEICDVAMTAAFYGQHGRSMLRDRRHRGSVPLVTGVQERHVPLGVVGVIAPWNYPFTLVISDAIAALVAGNAVVLKPDRQTPASALAAAALLRMVGVPDDVFQIVTGAGSELGGPLIAGSDYLMFTGSSATGRTVASQAGQALIGYSAELGGKNPMIICDDADVARAVPAAVKACFSNTGQLCISIERIFVDDAIWDRFVPAFVRAVGAMDVSASMGWDADCGPLISATQRETVERHVDDARAKGATVLAGGHVLPDVGPTAYAPTVLTDVPEDAELFAHETFGPVVSLYRTHGDQDAISRANASEYGLNAAVWTRNLRRGQSIARQLKCGTVNVNEGYAAAWSSLRAPMGGMGISGVGRRHGAQGLTKYTQSQTIATQHLMALQAPSGMSQEMFAKLMRAFVKLESKLGI